MKRFSMLMLIAILALSACGFELNVGDEKDVEAQESSKEKSETVDKEDEESESPETDEKDDGDSSIVEIILPASFYEGMPQEGVSADLNAEGMDDIDSDLKGMVEMMDVESITDISMNDDVTKLTVSINQELYDEYMNGLVLMDFALYASMFQMMNGLSEEDFDFEVVLVDDKTGEEIERTSVYDE